MLENQIKTLTNNLKTAEILNPSKTSVNNQYQNCIDCNCDCVCDCNCDCDCVCMDPGSKYE